MTQIKEKTEICKGVVIATVVAENGFHREGPIDAVLKFSLGRDICDLETSASQVQA